MPNETRRRRQPIAAVVCVGDELLAGDIADANASWLARELASLGLRVSMMATLPDHRSSISRFVSWARLEYDVVIVTGGLGGTPDDVTRDGIADGFGVERRLDDARAAAVRARGGHAAVFADEWCRLPAGSRVLDGIDGGALPFAVENVYVCPGVPAEMRASFETVRDELRMGPPREAWRGSYRTREDEIVALLAHVQQEHPAVRVGSYPRGTDQHEVELVVRAEERSALDAAVATLEAALAERRIENAS